MRVSAQDLYGSAWFQNAIPTGTVEFENGMTPKQVMRLAEEWAVAHEPSWKFPKNTGLVKSRKVYLRTDMMSVKLFLDDESFEFDRAEGGGLNEILTLRKIRHSEDAHEVVHLLGAEGPVEVVCQPLEARNRPVGAALVYQGGLTVVRPDILDPNYSKPSFLTVSLDDWVVKVRP